MKNVTTFLFLVCFVFNLQAQTVNGVPLKDIKSEYVQIKGTSKLLSSKINIELDFGQHNKYFKVKDTQLMDENDKLITLNSMVDALNFMTKYGYEFVQAYAFSVGNQNVYHYLLRKKQ